MKAFVHNMNEIYTDLTTYVRGMDLPDCLIDENCNTIQEHKISIHYCGLVMLTGALVCRHWPVSKTNAHFKSIRIGSKVLHSDLQF